MYIKCHLHRFDSNLLQIRPFFCFKHACYGLRTWAVLSVIFSRLNTKTGKNYIVLTIKSAKSRSRSCLRRRLRLWAAAEPAKLVQLKHMYLQFHDRTLERYGGLSTTLTNWNTTTRQKHIWFFWNCAQQILWNRKPKNCSKVYLKFLFNSVLLSFLSRLYV